MTINFYDNNNNSRSVTSADQILRYTKALKKFKDFPFPIPTKIIIIYQKSFIDLLREKYQLKQYPFLMNASLYYPPTSEKEVAPPWAIVSNFGFGAPTLAVLMELLVALKCKVFISCGTAGAIQKNLKPGDIVVCERARREEGTSFHYLANSKQNYPYVSAGETITEKIKISCQNLQENFYAGCSWTTDAAYRETVDKVKKYQSQGILTVDMESSALFAIAKYYQLEAGTIFTISDSLANLKWTPHFKSKALFAGLEKSFLIADSALLKFSIPS